MCRLTFLVIALAVFPSSSASQLAPDTPRLISPSGPGGLGVHWLKPGAFAQDDDALLVTWAFPGLPPGVRLRGGAGEGTDGQTAGFAGLDVQSPLVRDDASLPFDLDWQAGVGVGFGENLLVTVPLGVSAGISWSSGAVWMAPYVSAGLAADLRLGEEFEGEEFEVYPALDIGLDLSLDSGRRFILRAASSLGDRQAVAIGLVIGGGGRTRGPSPDRGSGP